VYEREAIEAWFALGNRTSPMTNLPLANLELTPAVALQERAAAWRAATVYAVNVTRPELPTIGSLLFANLDKFPSLYQTVGLQPPVLIVLGMEGHGKSTVVDRLVGFPVFPRGAAVSTRMAVRVCLRRGPAQLGEVGVYAVGSASPAVVRHVALEGVCGVVLALMNECVRAAGRPYVTDTELRVTIQVPFAPHLDVLDLPGFVGDGTEPELIAERALEREKPNAICVFVQDARQEPKLSAASRLVIKHGMVARTHGIFTFADIAVDAKGLEHSHAARLRMLFTTENEKYAGLGWVAVASPVDEGEIAKAVGCLEVARLHQMNALEATRLGEIAAEVDDDGVRMLSAAFAAKHMGMDAARGSVQETLELYMLRRWGPALQKHMTAHAQGMCADTIQIGMPIPDNGVNDTVLGVIKRCREHLPADFPAARLEPVVAEVLKEIVLQRARAQLSGDWVKLGDEGAVLALKDAIGAFADEKTATWGATPFAYMSAHIEADTAAADLLRRGAALKDALVALGTAAGALLGRLRDARIFTDARHPAPGDDHRLGRLAEVEDSFMACMGRQFAEATTLFEERAQALLDDSARNRPVVVYRRPSAAGAPMTATVRWGSDADCLGERLMELWVRTVPDVVGLAAAWRIPDAIQEKPEWDDARMATLAGVARAAEVLEALHALKDRVGRTEVGMNRV
jgi:hypothetical protein